MFNDFFIEGEMDLLEAINIQMMMESNLKTEICKIRLGNKDYSVSIFIENFTGYHPNSDKQKKAYDHFIKNKDKIMKKASDELFEYSKKAALDSDINISSLKDMSKYINPLEIYIDGNGNVSLLLDCTWDQEHGIGISLYPSIHAGIMDEFI